MTPRFWVCLVAVLAAPMVYGQTTPVPAQDPDDSRYASDEGDYDDGAPEEDDIPTAPTAPPEMPDERPSARPYAGAVWASGHWDWDGNEWRYVNGSWVAAMPGYRFINGYWEQDSQGWRWVSGGWARPDSNMVEIPVEPSGEALTTTQAPPAPQMEEPPPAPAQNLTWTPGYWYWEGDNWEWVAGMWVEPPRPGLVYVSPRWVPRGPSWYFSWGGWAVRGSVRVTVPVYPYVSVRTSWGSPHAYRYTWHRYPAYHHGYRVRDYGYRSRNYVYRNRDHGYRSRDHGYRSHDSSYRSHDSGSRNRGSSRWGESRSHGSNSHSASPGGNSRGRGHGRH